MALTVKKFIRDKLKTSSNIKDLKVGDIVVEDGFVVMTQDTLAYLLSLAEQRENIKPI
jgi:tartrate dehydratase beta subunit/fumarate hydratase class I family protein